MSVVFLALQGFMMLMLEAFFRFTSLARTQWSAGGLHIDWAAFPMPIAAPRCAGAHDRAWDASVTNLSDQRRPVILSHSRTNSVCVFRNASQSVGARIFICVIGMPPAGGGTSARGE